jgi:hypothetical protein
LLGDELIATNVEFAVGDAFRGARGNPPIKRLLKLLMGALYACCHTLLYSGWLVSILHVWRLLHRAASITFLHTRGRIACNKGANAFNVASRS